MFYYLYEIRNNLTGKIYVGVHKTKSMDDGYVGSGKVIRSAIEKYGIENFTKTVLEEFSTAEEMFAREKEIVNDEFLLRKDVYNLRRGGSGGFDYINNSGIDKFKNKNHSDDTKQKIGMARRNAIENGTFVPLPTSEETKKKISERKVGTKYKSKPPKSDEHKKKISEAIKKKWLERKCG